VRPITIVTAILTTSSYQNCSEVEFSVSKAKIQAINTGPDTGGTTGGDGSSTGGTTGGDGSSTGGTTGQGPNSPPPPADCADRKHLEVWDETVESNVPVLPECPIRVKDVAQKKRCENGVIVDIGFPTVTIRDLGFCSCDGKTHGTEETNTLAGGSRRELECSQKVETCDVESRRRCDNGTWVTMGTTNVNCRTNGSCPIACGDHADGSSWNVHTDDYTSNSDPACPYGGKVRYYDLDVTYRCSAGVTSELSRVVSLDRTVGNCNCDGYIHGSRWTLTTPNGATGTATCSGKTLYYDVEEDKTCTEGLVSNLGNPRNVNPHEVGSCDQPCPEETIWECGVDTPYAWGDQGLFYGPNQGRYVRVNGPWTQTCIAPDADYFSNYTDVRAQVWSLADDAALTRVNGVVHMDEQATCAIKNKVTYPSPDFGQRYDLQIDWCDNSGCAGSACRVTVSYVGRKKGSCQ